MTRQRFFTERDRQVIEALGYEAPGGFGQRPALLVVDVTLAFCGERPEPILEAIRQWRTSCGEAAWAALPTIARVIATAREREIPVIYTTGFGRADQWDSGAWLFKGRGRAARPAPSDRDGNAIMPQIAPGPRDIVVLKQKPSAFFGTNLAAYLVLLGCDSLIVTGSTTSGCVRATVVDAFSHNYRVAVVGDACFDRLETSHTVSLVDMNAKYADVVSSGEVIDYLTRLPRGLFELPTGH